jgi:hypothetical protein
LPAINSCWVLDADARELEVAVSATLLSDKADESLDHIVTPLTCLDSSTAPDIKMLLLGFTLPTIEFVIVTTGTTGDTTFTTTTALADLVSDGSRNSRDKLDVVLAASAADANTASTSVPLNEIAHVLDIVGAVWRQLHVNLSPALVPVTPLTSASKLRDASTAIVL